MASYRVTLSPGAMRAGVAPERVIPTVADAIAELTTVEASDLQLVRGTPRIVVRFESDDDELAEQVAAHAASVASSVVEVAGWFLTRRDGGRWKRVA
ncbi:hypothetical protein [Paramicrobacterium agarici]|uniref:Uncharacterized protein n=1 Tax=Paramicrobacterium agarici TaxID=630514 RepID=A0A2A9DVY1_9MICO|nr:hypothetical protein [Microbacterium agarici]PFG30152.1 hypothetical protein ATJ78_1074 [Microbacterium agarici]TQO23160.1 hypothetical protein FB385_2006 [Microbacterium agarici]